MPSQEAIERAELQDRAGGHAAASKIWSTAAKIVDEGLCQPLPPGLGLEAAHSNVQRWRVDLQRWRAAIGERLARSAPAAGAPSVLLAGLGEGAAPHTVQIAHPDGSRHLRRAPSAPTNPSNSTPSAPPPVRRPASGPARSDERIFEDRILEEVLDRSPSVGWDDVAGLEGAKRALQELVVLPMLRQDLFQGLRAPARGLLLYGPPGNGKTLLAKALAREAGATFFNISAASLTSKWVGEGEKLVRALFRVADAAAPAIIFMDELDSLLGSRGGEGEHEASRRLKTEFLAAMDGVASSDRHVLLLGATNRPWDLDEAVIRRLPKRLYVPLPDLPARRAMLERLLRGQRCARDVPAAVAPRTRGYTGSDLAALCREAAMMPIRELGARVATVPADKVRGLNVADFEAALAVIRPSLDDAGLARFEQWTRQHGALAV